jgi:hypothetical protein
MKVFVSVLSAVVFSTTGFVYSSSIVDEVRGVLNTQHVDTRQAIFTLSRIPKRLSGETKDKITRYALAMRCIYEEITSSGDDDHCACGIEFTWHGILACGEANLCDACCDYCGGARRKGYRLYKKIKLIARDCPQIYTSADPSAPFSSVTAGSQ